MGSVHHPCGEMQTYLILFPLHIWNVCGIFLDFFLLGIYFIQQTPFVPHFLSGQLLLILSLNLDKS